MYIDANIMGLLLLELFPIRKGVTMGTFLIGAGLIICITLVLGPWSDCRRDYDISLKEYLAHVYLRSEDKVIPYLQALQEKRRVLLLQLLDDARREQSANPIMISVIEERLIRHDEQVKRTANRREQTLIEDAKKTVEKNLKKLQRELGAQNTGKKNGQKGEISLAQNQGGEISLAQKQGGEISPADR